MTKFPWLDTSKSFHERAVLLCNELTLREKVDQLGNNVAEDIMSAYNVGSTNGNPMSITLSLNATEAANYLFSFKSGNNSGTATVSLSLKNSSALNA